MLVFCTFRCYISIVSQTGHYAKWNSEDFPSSSAMLKENKEKFNNTDITPKKVQKTSIYGLLKNII